MSNPLRDKLAELLPRWRAEVGTLVGEHGTVAVSEVSVMQLLGGLRGAIGVVCDTSEVHPQRGLLVRGRLVTELAGIDAESLFWLLLTGEIPNESEQIWLLQELRRRSVLPDWFAGAIAVLPRGTHPVVNFIHSVQLLQQRSHFAAAYGELPKERLWEAALEDALDLLAVLPTLAAWSYHGRAPAQPAGDSADWTARFASQLELTLSDEKQAEFGDLLRLYVLAHCDHEGSNACAYACHVTGSALADPYLALTSGYRALAGPIHGLASQVCVEFVLGIRAAHGVPDDSELHAICEQRIASGKVIPGFGHAVLREMDPRYVLLRNFAEAHYPEDELMRISAGLLRVVPPLLQSAGKVSNPWPNVDGITGAVLHHYGMRNYGFLTVLFALCMSLGMLAQLVVNRGLGTPIMRPRSITTDELKDLVASD